MAETTDGRAELGGNDDGAAVRDAESWLHPREPSQGGGMDAGLSGIDLLGLPQELAASATAWVREKPLTAAAVAFGLGFLIGRVGR